MWWLPYKDWAGYAKMPCHSRVYESTGVVFHREHHPLSLEEVQNPGACRDQSIYRGWFCTQLKHFDTGRSPHLIPTRTPIRFWAIARNWGSEQGETTKDAEPSYHEFSRIWQDSNSGKDDDKEGNSGSEDENSDEGGNVSEGSGEGDNDD